MFEDLDEHEIVKALQSEKYSSPKDFVALTKLYFVKKK
jgi:hypothetical protein